MGCAYPEEEIPRGPEGENLSSGAFPVPKDLEEDRHVTDRRRANWAEFAWPNPKVLPHGVQFGYRVLHDDEELEVYVYDLPHFYHAVYLGSKMGSTSPVGPPLEKQVLEALGFPL